MSTPGFTYFAVAGISLLTTGPGSMRATSFGIPGVYGQVQLYDGLDATGTLLTTINANVGRDIDFSCQFSTGLFVVTTGNPNVTIVFF
jgi:hypothetical protein